MILRSTAITSFVSFGTTAEFSGTGDSNFGPVNFIVRVDDDGEPGTLDTFGILVSNGYFQIGTLQGGNIQAHG